MFQLVRNFRQAPLALADQVLVSGVNFITGIILARGLGMQGFGLFSLAWLMVLFFSSLQQSLIVAPMQSLIVRKKPEVQHLVLSSLFTQQLLLCLIAASIMFVLMWFPSLLSVKAYPSSFQWLIPLAVVSFLLTEYFRKLFFVRAQPVRALELDLISYGLQLVLMTIAWRSGQLTIDISLLIISGTNLLSAFYGWLISPGVAVRWNGSVGAIVETWKYSRWLAGTSILQYTAGNVFLLTAGGWLGATALGAIRMGQNVMGVLNVIFLAMENFIPSSAARIYEAAGVEALGRYLKKVISVAGLFTLLVLLLIVVLREPLVTLLYGGDYVSYSGILAAFALLYCFVFTGMPLRFFIRTIGKNREIFVSYFLSTLFSVITAVPFIQTFGIYGVVGGMVCSQIILQSWYIYVLQPELKAVWKSFT